LPEKARNGGIAEDAIDEVGEAVYIPEVHLEGVAEDFGDAGLFGDDDRDAGSQGF
jgi:hypothetical protein